MSVNIDITKFPTTCVLLAHKVNVSLSISNKFTLTSSLTRSMFLKWAPRAKVGASGVLKFRFELFNWLSLVASSA